MEEIADVRVPADFGVWDFESRSLTAMDRCDRCSAAAKARVIKRSNGVVTAELMFCGHHLNKYADGLTDAGFTVTS